MQTRSLETYMQMPYRTYVAADKCGDKSCFVAYHPELEGCMAQGDTWEEAINNLKSAKSEYIALCLELGWEVPVPQLQIDFPQHRTNSIQDNTVCFVGGFSSEVKSNLIMA